MNRRSTIHEPRTTRRTVRVKICGITNAADARHAAACGADALGFVFAESPRRVRAAEARRIIRALGPWVTPVGVFVDENPRAILAAVRECRLGAVQLHGAEDPREAHLLSRAVRVIKAFRVGPDFDAAAAAAYPADALLFDAYVPGIAGGTGRVFDWKRLAGRRWRTPIVLSGGLTPANVARAVKNLAPYGVDTSSGVERSPGKKAPALVKEFIRNAKRI